MSWCLRAVLSLARLRLHQGRETEARELVAETYARFTEGFGTANLIAARQLLDAAESKARRLQLDES